MLRSARSLLRLRSLATTGVSVSKIQAPSFAPLLMCARRMYSTPADDTPKQQQKIKPQSHPLRKQQGSATPSKSPQADATQAGASVDFRFDVDTEAGQLAQLFYNEINEDDNLFKKTVEDLLRFVKTLESNQDLRTVYEMEAMPSTEALLDQLIQELGRDFAPESRQFLSYLQVNNKSALLGSIVNALQAAFNQKYNIHYINVTLAEYNPKLNDKLTRFFDDVMPAGHSYNLSVMADPDILGGMVVEVGQGITADFSIAKILINAVVKKSEQEIRYESL